MEVRMTVEVRVMVSDSDGGEWWQVTVRVVMMK